MSGGKRPSGPCERDANGMCLGKCGRRGHLGRPLTVKEWLSFFGTDVEGSSAEAAFCKSYRRVGSDSKAGR